MTQASFLDGRAPRAAALGKGILLPKGEPQLVMRGQKMGAELVGLEGLEGAGPFSALFPDCSIPGRSSSWGDRGLCSQRCPFCARPVCYWRSSLPGSCCKFLDSSACHSPPQRPCLTLTLWSPSRCGLLLWSQQQVWRPLAALKCRAPFSEVRATPAHRLLKVKVNVFHLFLLFFPFSF